MSPPQRWTLSAETLTRRIAERSPDLAEALSPVLQFEKGSTLTKVMRDHAHAAIEAALTVADREAAFELDVLARHLAGAATADTVWLVATEPSHLGPPEPTDTQRLRAAVIAVAVRNAIDSTHPNLLSDDAGPEFNRAVRDAVVTALHAFDHLGEPAADQWLLNHTIQVSLDWEPAQLDNNYIATWGT